MGGSLVAGGKMKTTGTIPAGTGYWEDPNTGATNESGFTGVPGGVRNEISGIFSLLGNGGWWWTATEANSATAFFFVLFYSNSDLGPDNEDKEKGMSIRCVKD